MSGRVDVAIVGGGIAGLMAAWRLTERHPHLKVCVLEKGGALDKRRCPIIADRKSVCVNCPSCAVMEGMAGAGAFSDGKYVISTEYGGWLTDAMAPETAMGYIEQADGILCAAGATKDCFLPDNELKALCLRYDLHMQQAKLKHLGTDANLATMQQMIDTLSDRCELLSGHTVTDVDRESRTLTVRHGDREFAMEARTVLFAVGRAGSEFFAEWCRRNGLTLDSTQVDIGVRVELPSAVWQHFSEKIYEPKIWHRSKRYGDVTRMFCFNERGHVVMENTRGVLTVNGHAYKDEAKKSDNSNFALLSTLRFTEPFKEPIRYARAVASLANMLSGGVLVQRLGDLRAGRRSNAHRLKASTTRPTLAAVPGDLSLCLPKRQLDNVIETLDALDQVAPGTANHDTLLYGVECKYYSSRPRCEDFELEGCPGIYAAGDGSGFTRSLSHAAANGLYVADKIGEVLG